MEKFKWSSSGWIAILLAFLLFTGVIVAYVWAVVRKDVEAFIPFISDAGGYPPQSGVFAIFLFLSAMIGFLGMVIRYYSLKTLAEGMRLTRILNIISLLLGIVTLCGMVVVASYPVNTRPKDIEQCVKLVVVPHTLGAFAAFCVGILYAVSQTAISFLVRTSKSYKSATMIIFYVRCVLCTLAFIALVVMITAPAENNNSNEGTTLPDLTTSVPPTTTVGPQRCDTNSWTSNGRKVSILAEWVLAFCLFGSFLSLYPEMKHFGVEVSIARKSEFSRLTEQYSQNNSQSSLRT